MASGRPDSARVSDEQTNEGAQTGRLTRVLAWTAAQLDGRSGVRDGWYPEMDGMIAGAGLSAGPGYRQHLFGDHVIVDASAAASWNGYRMMQSQLTWPRLSGERLQIGAQLKYQDFTQINYFGIGNATQKGDQTDYRLKDIDATGFATIRATPWLSLTGRVGTLRRVAIEPGTSTLHPSIDERFNEASAPGLTQAPNYLHADVVLDVDTLDVPGYPSSGGRYRLSMAMFHDQEFTGHSFSRAEAEAAHYVALGRTTLALRGRLDISQSGAGQTVPFYMLPSLGGANSLRGYLDYRFRDQDAMLLDAEYRWPLLRHLDAAVFYDTGAVAPSVSALTDGMSSDYGVGLRVHSARHLLVRLDVARGGEGTRALVSFSAPLGLRSSRAIAPYVP
ncbi:MAG: BamA/TamA family outer membrane protein [Vicinamibacterales bacterium]